MINLTPEQLRRAADIQEQILGLQAELRDLLEAPGQPGAPATPSLPVPPRKRQLSAQGIANIRAGVAKRMANRAGASPGKNDDSPSGKRTMSPEARAKLAALARSRWRKAKAQGKSRL